MRFSEIKARFRANADQLALHMELVRGLSKIAFKVSPTLAVISVGNSLLTNAFSAKGGIAGAALAHLCVGAGTAACTVGAALVGIVGGAAFGYAVSSLVDLKERTEHVGFFPASCMGTAALCGVAWGMVGGFDSVTTFVDAQMFEPDAQVQAGPAAQTPFRVDRQGACSVVTLRA